MSEQQSNTGREMSRVALLRFGVWWEFKKERANAQAAEENSIDKKKSA